MRRICAGRTVLIIAHRLSAVREANRIVVIERGQIAEVGSHEELLRHRQGIYSHLYRLQQSGPPVHQAHQASHPSGTQSAAPGAPAPMAQALAAS